MSGDPNIDSSSFEQEALNPKVPQPDNSFTSVGVLLAKNKYISSTMVGTSPRPKPSNRQASNDLFALSLVNPERRKDALSCPEVVLRAESRN